MGFHSFLRAIVTQGTPGRVVATSALLIAALPGTAMAQAQPAGAIRYGFQTLMIVDPPQERSITVLKKDGWFMGRAEPAHAAVLEADVTIAEIGVTIEKGTVLAISDGDYFAGCTDKATARAGVLGMGRLAVCLMDLDRDGVLDSWYKSSVPILWSHDHGHVQRDDIHPVTPVKTRMLTIEEIRALPPWGGFDIKYAQGTLTYCLYLEVCLSRQPRIKPSEVEQTTEMMGGEFAYRLIDGKHLAVRMIREPVEALF